VKNPLCNNTNEIKKIFQKLLRGCAEKSIIAVAVAFQGVEKLKNKCSGFSKLLL